MKDFKFNAAEVVCNGISIGAKSTLTEDNYQTLSTFLKTHFMMSPQNVILEELNDSNRIQYNWMVGRRVKSIDDIITRMVSGMYTYAQTKFEKRELSEMWINAQIKMMTAADIITVMEKALIDCATADYWYTYEKDWG